MNKTILERFTKRLMDIIVSGTFICTLYPFIFVFVWLGNKLTKSDGPVYFLQERTGLNGKPFIMYKFRSLIENDEADTVQTTREDPRTTSFGAFLRRSSIDELPQFINVLLGDMTLIGPRPHMTYHTQMYSALIDNYRDRLVVKPGITGWAQVKGYRGETKTVKDMADRVEHDLWYIEHWSLWLDIKIFIMSLRFVVLGHDEQAY